MNRSLTKAERQHRKRLQSLAPCPDSPVLAARKSEQSGRALRRQKHAAEMAEQKAAKAKRGLLEKQMADFDLFPDDGPTEHDPEQEWESHLAHVYAEDWRGSDDDDLPPAAWPAAAIAVDSRWHRPLPDLPPVPPSGDDEIPF